MGRKDFTPCCGYPNTRDMENQPASIEDTLTKYLEPVLIIAVLTASIYFVGYLYIQTFLSRFGLQRSVDITFEFIVTQSIGAIYIAILLFGAFIYVFYRPLTNRYSVALANLPFLVLAFFFLRYSVNPSDNQMTSILFPILGILIMLLFLGMVYAKIALLWDFWHATIERRILVILTLLLIISLLSISLGSFHATTLIEDTKTETRFFLKGNSSIDIEGRDMVVILHRNEFYFVTPRVKPAPRYPRVYIIHDKQIEFASAGETEANKTPLFNSSGSRDPPQP